MKLPHAIRGVLVLGCMVAVGGCTLPGTESAQDKRDRQAAEQLRSDAQSYEVERAQQAADPAFGEEEAEIDGAGEAEPADDLDAEAEPDAESEPTRTSSLTRSRPGDAKPSTAAKRPLLTAADRTSFSRLAAQLPGRSGIAVALIGKGQTVYKAGSLTGGVAWSTAKVPVAMAAIDAGKARDSDVRSALTVSDNAAAERLWSGLGSSSAAADAANAQLRAAGDSRTRMQSRRLRSGYTAFGQTSWLLTDQVRFAGGLHCTSAGKRVRELMGQVTSSQRWGIGKLQSPMLKGGWGPGTKPGRGDGWLDRQFGIVTIGGKRVAIAIASTAGDHGTATRSLDRIAAWARTNVDTRGGGKARC